MWLSTWRVDAPRQTKPLYLRPGLSDEQDAIVTGIVRGIRTNKRLILGGYAGTGKTTCIRALKERLPSFAVCAFTGKAADVLRRKGIADAKTIHSTIYVPVRGPDGQTHFELREELGLDIGGFIVDEASMISRSVYQNLMSFGRPCIFVGDHGQLEPVGSDFNLMSTPDFVLERVHRNSGEIPRFAEWLRFGRSASDFKPTSATVTLIKPREVSTEAVLSADQIICAFNRTRVSLNERARRALGRKELAEVSDRVMCLRNDRDAGIFNGMQGTVSKVAEVAGDLYIDFDTYDGTREGLLVDRDQFGRERGPDVDARSPIHPFDYCYAITCHKAQGDEWPSVLVYEQRCQRWDHRRWAYTAASRAQHKLTWVTENGGGR